MNDKENITISAPMQAAHMDKTTIEATQAFHKKINRMMACRSGLQHEEIKQ